MPEPQNTTTPVTSPYAPLTADGPLPPSFTESMVSSAYKAFRADLRPKKVLATLGIRPGLEQANRALRRALDSPGAREGDNEAPDAAVRPPLFLALYVWLRDNLASADGVYKTIVKPAETDVEDKTFLNAQLFGEKVAEASGRFAGTGDVIANGSESEALALFALAYGLLQKEEAEAIVRPVAALGPAFQKFFGIGG